MGEQNINMTFENSNEYKSPLDFSRLKAKPWKHVTHGLYKDIFNLAVSPREKNTRPMQMQPDFDFKVDRRDKNGESVLPMSLAAIERESTKLAREELKKVILA